MVAAAAAAATAHGLYAVAEASDVPQPVAVLYPVMTDGLALVAYSATNRLTGKGRRYAWTVVVAAAGLSGTAQAVYLATDGLETALPGVRFGIGAAPAVAAAAVAHLLHLIRLADATSTPNRREIEPLETRPAPIPEPAPSVGAAVQSLPAHWTRTPPDPADSYSPPPGPPAQSRGSGARPDELYAAVEQRAVLPPEPARESPVDRSPLSEGGGATQRAEQAALQHLATHAALPTATELVRLTGVSRGTAGTVLKALRDAAHATSSAPDSPTTAPAPPTTAPASDPTKQSAALLPDQSELPHHDHPTHVPNKIEIQYTPRHHDPQEDQLRADSGPIPEPAPGR